MPSFCGTLEFRDPDSVEMKRIIRGLGRRIQEGLRDHEIRNRSFQVPEDGIHVLVAKDPPPDGIERGGRVKFSALERAFPGSPDRFNILYVLSSALPAVPEAWIEWARRGGARVVWNQNGVGYPAWAPETYEAINAQFRRLMALTDHVIYQSTFCIASTSRWVGHEPTASTVIPNAVDTAFYTPRDPPLPPSPLILLLCGSHQTACRVEAPLDALQNLVSGNLDVQLRISGVFDFPGGETRVREMIAARSLQDRVRITGPYRREEAPALFREGHILIHPKYKDPCPTVVIEALASGLPVVGSATGGLPELVGDAGVLIEVEDSWDALITPSGDQLAEAVRTLLDRHADHAACARNRAVTLFDETGWIQAHHEAFVQVLATAGRA